MAFTRGGSCRSSRTAAPSSDVSAALNAALRLLTAREYSKGELQDKLLRRYTKEAAAAAVAQCAEQGWQSDVRTAQMLIRHCELNGYGPQKLKYEALRRQVPLDLVIEQSADTAWTDIALEVLKRRCPDPSSLDRPAAQKLLALLSRRGFLSGQCIKALELLRTNPEPA